MLFKRLRLLNRQFIETNEFKKRWHELGLNDDNLYDLQTVITNNPDVGSVVIGTGGMRKLRFPLPGKGKSKGIRVCYVDFPQKQICILITVYSKKEKDNITNEEKHVIRKLISKLEDYYGGI